PRRRPRADSRPGARGRPLMPTEETGEHTLQRARSLVATAREAIDAEWTFATGQRAKDSDYQFLKDLRRVLIGCTVSLEHQLKSGRDTADQSPGEAAELAAIMSYAAA